MNMKRLLTSLLVLVGMLAWAAPASAANQQSATMAQVSGTVSSFTEATARFRVPAVDCSVGGSQSANVGVGWHNESSTAATIVAVHFGCANGSPTYSAAILESDTTGVASRELHVSAGDLIGARLTYNSA